MAFSQGAALAATLICQKAQDTSGLSTNPTFKFAVFLCGAIPFDYAALLEGQVRRLDPDIDGELITLPTANVWGRNDKEWPGVSEKLSKLCQSSENVSYVHESGHEIPRAPKETVMDMIRSIQSTMERSLLLQ